MLFEVIFGGDDMVSLRVVSVSVALELCPSCVGDVMQEGRDFVVETCARCSF